MHVCNPSFLVGVGRRIEVWGQPVQKHKTVSENKLKQVWGPEYTPQKEKEGRKERERKRERERKGEGKEGRIV
jgi:hypothetical protein